jgi:hypothetical protein
MGLYETGWSGIDWTGLAQEREGPEEGSWEHNNQP